MHPVLERILADKRKGVEQIKETGLPLDVNGAMPAVRDFRAAVSRKGGINLIAEIKFASPSAGTLSADGDPARIARTYETAGAAAVSVLTEGRFFKGDIRYVPLVRRAVSLPVLRKDFLIDPLQVAESAAVGADAILLIVGILSARRLTELLTLAGEYGIACLTEVHNHSELDTALSCGADIIGINNRDLSTFEVDMNTVIRLAPLIPEGCVRVSESGISKSEDLARLRRTGVEAVLVGTSLMRSQDVEAKVRELVAAGRHHDTG